MKGIERRLDRGTAKWGFRKYYRGKTWRRFLWDTEAEAEAAYRRFLKEEFEPLKKIPKNALIKVVNDFIAYSAEQVRSKWRIEGLSYSFSAVIVPYFGATTPITDIDDVWVNKFVLAQKKRFQVRRIKTNRGYRMVKTKLPIKNSTIWHYVTDLSALYNYAINLKQPLALVNPVMTANLSPIANRKFIKLPLDPGDVERAREYLTFSDQVFFDHLRFTGARKDEGNRTEWEHLVLADVDNALAIIPGTKTEEAIEIIPIPRSHAENLLKWKALCPSERWVFPSCRPHSKSYGEKMYRRTRMFEGIKRRSALAAYMKANPKVGKRQAQIAVKKSGYAGGIKLVPKDLRDYFCNEVAANTHDPILLMNLMRHKSLQTTTKYTRRILERMKRVVANFGSEKLAPEGPKRADYSISRVLDEIKELRASVEKIR